MSYLILSSSSMSYRLGRLRLARLAASSAMLFTASTYACGGGGNDLPTKPGDLPNTPEPQAPEPLPPVADLSALRVISGAGQTDTILAVLPQALVVEIRDSASALTAGRTVRFTAVSSVAVSPLGAQSFTGLATDVSDGQGQAQALVRLGLAAGEARVEVAVPAFGLVDTVSFTVNRGAPARFTISPLDTAIAPGGSYTLQVERITDQGNNPIPGAVATFSATGASVTSSGEVTVPNTSPLRAKITVSCQQASDSAKVSVYPRIPMVIAREDRTGSTVVLINSDGTGSSDVAATPDVSISPSSVAATPSVVYYRGDPASNSKVWVAEPNAAPRALLPGETRTEAWPRLSPDGTWVYFARDMASLWRVKLDGTGLDSLTSFTMSRFYQAPAISPDGRTVAIEDGNGLQIVDVATKARSTVSVPCASPSYSPDGAYFACAASNDVSIVRTDGTGRRVLATFPRYEGPDGFSGLDWTPDGKWLLVMIEYEDAVLVEVSTGTVLPLRDLANSYFQPQFVH